MSGWTLVGAGKIPRIHLAHCMEPFSDQRGCNGADCGVPEGERGGMCLLPLSGRDYVGSGT